MPKLATHVELPDSGSTDREFDNVYRELAAKATSGATITSGAGAPSSTPTTIGDVYLDTTATREYRAYGTSSSADWKKLPFNYSDLFTITAGAGDVTRNLPSSWEGGFLKVIVSNTNTKWVNDTLTNNVVYFYETSYDALTSGTYSADKGMFCYRSSGGTYGFGGYDITGGYAGSPISATEKTITFDDTGTTLYIKYFVTA